MRTQLLPAALLALAAHVGAIKITSPAKNDVVDPSQGVTVKWTTVSTDPSRAHLVLVNMAAGHTPYSKDLGEVDLSKGSFVVTEKNVPRDEGYQFNFQSVESANTGILAQSEQFKVDTSKDSSSSSSSAAGSSTATGKTTSGAVTATGAASGSSTTPAPTTLATVPSSAGDTGSATAKQSGSTTRSATTSTSTGGAAVGPAIQGGSFLALLAGLAAFIA